MCAVCTSQYLIHIMRTHINIDDTLMANAMKAGPFKTKRDAVEAGLKLFGRQAAYREILKWRGKLKWEGGDDVDWTTSPDGASGHAVHEPPPPGKRRAGR